MKHLLPSTPTFHPSGLARDDAQQPSSETLFHSNVDSPNAISPLPMVMYDRANEDLLRPYAERVADLVGASMVQSAASNPVCCIWIEITGWTPNPGSRGYIINIQPGASIIQGSDEEQLRQAIERLETIAARHGDHIKLPTGLLTNYRMNAEQHASG